MLSDQPIASGPLAATPAVSGSYVVTPPVASLPVGSLPSTTLISVAGSLLSPYPTIMAYPATTFSGVGGTSPYTYSATGLPTGLSINSSTGVVSGTATATGTFSVIVTATDAHSNSGSTPTMTLVIYAYVPFQYPIMFEPNKKHTLLPSVITEFQFGTPLPLLRTIYSAVAQSSKFLGYAVLRPPVNAASASKLVGYAILQPADTTALRQYTERGPSVPRLPILRSEPFVQGLNAALYLTAPIQPPQIIDLGIGPRKITPSEMPLGSPLPVLTTIAPFKNFDFGVGPRKRFPSDQMPVNIAILTPVVVDTDDMVVTLMW